MRRRHLFTLAATAFAPSLRAQPFWPTHPVHLVVPAPAGSSLDIIARLLAERLRDRWAQPVLVDNKPGAGGMLGVDVAAKAAPDGHTLAVGFNGPVAFAPFMMKKMPYDPVKDLAPVVMTTSQPNVLAINAALPARTVREFVDWARARAGKVNYSSLGLGSSAHLTMELFMAEAGFAATHIPYNGSPPAALALAQGEADASFMTAPALLPHVRNSKVRMLATTAAQRPESLKDLPTLAESGYPTVESLAWNGLFAAAGTPESVIARIAADVTAVLREPATRSALDQQGLTAVGGTADEFRRLLTTESKRWGAIIHRIGLKLD